MGSRRTNIVNNTTTIIATPTVPARQPAVTSGRIAGNPVVYTIGSVSQPATLPDLAASSRPVAPVGSAWGSLPFVYSTNVYNAPKSINVPAQTVANNSLDTAGILKDEVCEEILNDPVSGTDQFVITGNGSATRFRFPESGAPTEIAVTNFATGDIVVPSEYTVLIRAQSVSWLIFNTAPTDGTSYTVKYVMGDKLFSRNVTAGTWTTWLTKLNDIQRTLETAKITGQIGSSFRNGYNTTTNRVPESYAYDLAIDAVIQLKRAIGAPGKTLSLENIASACNYLEDQLAKIYAGTGKRSQADSTVGGPLVKTPEVTRDAKIIFEFDDRYTSFKTTGSGATTYNFGTDRTKIYDRKFDSQIKAFYFDLNDFKLSRPALNLSPRLGSFGNGGNRDEQRTSPFGSNTALSSSPRPQPNPNRNTTTSKSNTGGTSTKAASTTPSGRGDPRDFGFSASEASRSSKSGFKDTGTTKGSSRFA